MSTSRLKLRSILILLILLAIIPAFFVKDLRSFFLLPSVQLGPVESRLQRVSFRADLLRKEILDYKRELIRLQNEKLRVENDFQREASKWLKLQEYLKQTVMVKKGAEAADKFEKNGFKYSDYIRNVRPIEWSPIPGVIVGEHLSQWNRSFEVNRGSNNGVEVGSPVVSGACIVGRVVSVTPWSCSISHITNSGISIPCYIGSKERPRGLLKGGLIKKVEGEFCKIKYIDRRGNAKFGQNVFTSGITGHYPPGFLLGKISKNLRRDSDMYFNVEIQPALAFSQINSVIILKSVLKRK